MAGAVSMTALAIYKSPKILYLPFFFNPLSF